MFENLTQSFQVITMDQQDSTRPDSPVREDGSEKTHDSGSDISFQRQPIQVETLQQRRKSFLAPKLELALRNGQIRKRKRVSFSSTVIMVNEDGEATVANEHEEPEPQKTQRQNVPIPLLIVTDPMEVMTISTKSDPAKPLLVNNFEQQNRALSEEIRALHRRTCGGETRGHRHGIPISPRSPSPRQSRNSSSTLRRHCQRTEATTSLTDVQQHNQNEGETSLSSSPESEYVPTDDSDNNTKTKWSNLPGRLWNTTAKALANTADRLRRYTSPHEEQWEEAERMWEEERHNKRTTPPTTRTPLERAAGEQMPFLEKRHAYGGVSSNWRERNPMSAAWYNVPYAESFEMFYAPYTNRGYPEELNGE